MLHNAVRESGEKHGFNFWKEFCVVEFLEI